MDTTTFPPNKEVEQENLLLPIGRIVQVNGISTLLNSLRYLSRPVTLAMVGQCTDAGYLEEVLALAREVKEETNHTITYVGIQSPEAIVEWYQKASGFLLPSLIIEGCPMVSLEALPSGTPVVASRVGGIPEVVQHGKSGILIPPNNAMKLAEGVQYLSDNEKTRAQFGEEGRGIVEQNFSRKATTHKLLEIYREVV